MITNYTVLLLAAIFVTYCYSDCYFHNPRGSNNRLNENSANRRNGNRMFDSQNNNRGGYNKGDATDKAAGNDKNKQYDMKYFQSSIESAKKGSSKGKTHFIFEWTNQHGLGFDNDKLNSNMVFQMMCQENSPTKNGKSDMRDGTSTNTQDYRAFSDRSKKIETKDQYLGRERSVRTDRGLHEPFANYANCQYRQRNKGLFIADQKVGEEATKTRQNPGGTRRGYECPEERDHYPYWHPTYWKDVAVLTSTPDRCDYYKEESFNVKPKHECVENFRGSNEPAPYSSANNEGECQEKGGKWMAFHNYLEKVDGVTTEAACVAKNNPQFNIKYIWGFTHDDRKEHCLVALDQPKCEAADFSRVNHLGNSKGLKMLSYALDLPYFPSGKEQKCVFRMRYNISTADYDPWNTNSSHNNNVLKEEGLEPLISNDPKVLIGADRTPLALAINTAQFGRTFQDRSHVVILRNRETHSVPNDVNIHNLNVRGKRGNIVQTFPSVEYDFTPKNLEMKADDLMHIQWTGSNTHNNGNPEGDGQAGDAGEGTGGTDRNNVVGLINADTNYPIAMEATKDNLFANCEALWLSKGKKESLNSIDIQVQFATAGFFTCANKATCDKESVESKTTAFNAQLNNANASFEGAILKCKKGKYNIMCTRNNNFTNRSQKGKVNVK